MMYAGSKNKLVHTVQLSKVCPTWLVSPVDLGLAHTKHELLRGAEAVTSLTLSSETMSRSCLSLQVFEIRNTEDLTEEWLREKLGFFG